MTQPAAQPPAAQPAPYQPPPAAQPAPYQPPPAAAQPAPAAPKAKYRLSMSPSQYEKFSCLRKGAFEYVENHREPFKEGARNLGSDLHENVAEPWLRDGVEPDRMRSLNVTKTKRDGTDYEVTYYPGQIFESGIHLLPRPGVTLVEGAIELDIGGVLWKGKRDGLYLVPEESPEHRTYPDRNPRHQVDIRPYLAAGELPPDLIPEVLDHKTTQDACWSLEATRGVTAKAFGKTFVKPSLLDDVQWNTYAWDLLTRFPALPFVYGRWVYYLTDTKKKAKAWPVDVVGTRTQVGDAVGGITDRANLILQIRREKPRAMDLPPNLDECDSYGGCPHRGVRCELTIAERVQHTEGHKMGVAEILAAEMAKRAAESGQPVPVHQAMPAPAPVAPAQPAPSPAPYTPAPVKAPEPAKCWQPGDELSDAQELMVSQGKQLWVVAMAADFPPEAEVALAWPNAKLTYVKPERGVINAPEAKPLAAASPDQAVQIHGTGVAKAAPQANTKRAALKARAEELGCVDPQTGKPITQSSRHGDETLEALIAAKEGRPAPATQPAPVQAEPAPQAVHVQVPAEAPTPAAIQAAVAQAIAAGNADQAAALADAAMPPPAQAPETQQPGEVSFLGQSHRLFLIACEVSALSRIVPVLSLMANQPGVAVKGV